MKILTRMQSNPTKISTFTVYPLNYYKGNKLIYSDKYYTLDQMNRPEFIKIQLSVIASYWVGLCKALL